MFFTTTDADLDAAEETQIAAAMAQTTAAAENKLNLIKHKV